MNFEEITNLVTRLNEVKSSLNTQIQVAIGTAITEKILPSNKNNSERRVEEITASWT